MHVHVIYECHNCGHLANMSTEKMDQILGMASHSLVKGYGNWCTPIEEQKEDFKLFYNLKSNQQPNNEL